MANMQGGEVAPSDNQPAPLNDDEPVTPKKKSRRPRDAELSGLSRVRDQLVKIAAGVDKGFQDQTDRSNEQLENWDLYNNKLGFQQAYNGESKVFVPIVEAAVDARITRFSNQLFPDSGRVVQVMTSDGEYPQATMSLLEHYLRKNGMKTEIVPPMLLNGDVEGQYSLLAKWTSTTRRTVRRIMRPIEVEDVELEGEDFEDIEEEVIDDAFPDFDVIQDQDLCILPPTCKTVEEAIERGGSVTVRLKLTKGDIDQYIEDGDFLPGPGEQLKVEMTKLERYGKKSATKALASNMGIKVEGAGSTCEVYMIWCKLKVDGERVICRSYYAGFDTILGIKQNPYWCDRVPVLTKPQKRKGNLIKGKPPVSSVAGIQIAINDAINEGFDSAHYTMMPIIMSDPAKNPGPMILNMASVWRVDPNSTKILEFPKLYQDAFAIAAKGQEQIFQKLGVNPSMLPQQVSLKKQSQAEVAQQAQVDLLTTAQGVTAPEELLNQALEWMLWLDHQFRDKAILIQSFGEMGLRAEMEMVDPIQINARYVYRWNGVEAARNAAKLQQQIGFLNQARQMQPQMIPGHRMNLTPVITTIALGALGSRMAPLVVEDLSKTQTLDPELENKILDEGMPVHVHPLDKHPEHIKSHMAELQKTGDPHGTIMAHLMEHQQAMQAQAMQAQAAAQAQQPQGQGPPGAQTQGPRPMRGANGGIAPEAMSAAGGISEPRKF